MSARRVKDAQPPETPTGYRSTRRGSKALKSAKKAEQQHKLVTSVHRTGRSAKNVAIVLLQGAGALMFTVLALLVAALLINGAVRWNAVRLADRDSTVAERERRAKENMIVVGADGDKAVGFLALRVDREGEQIFGIAIPDGAFLDVPGRGFERVGDAYSSGPEVVASSISNYLTVPFQSYMIVPSSVYRDALTRQVVQGIPEQATGTNMAAEELSALSVVLSEIPQKNVALVAMPTKPIKLGEQTYFEPQREEVADLLKSWWGVDPSQANQSTRAVLYNGAGVPGIAGEAAQVLIRAGVRVVDTQNADSFDYAVTKIVVRRGDAKRGEEVKKVLGVGEVSVEPSSEDITDVVVIIGKDYQPNKTEKPKGN